MKWTEPDTAFIRAQRVGRLATISPQGEPHVVPACFAFDGEFFYTAVDQKRKRVPPEKLVRIQNVTQNPRVALILDEYQEDWSRLRYLLVRGEAALVEEQEERERAFRLLEEKYEQYLTSGLREAGWPLVRIVPRHVHRWRASSETAEGL